ncbi:hypothetical protein [Streptococcus mitis]|uniref:Uncharacterized protein n=1 Tax=Streptococcus mitis ATCC 6249 TaxID=864567 RepID=E0PPZ8_STRMT|nr:hypothetical protein [Streptococcus mitis]EFM31245.1 hypothetical protein HMPREF8571_0615 [Streptococcus mitis ATCC 6249]
MKPEELHAIASELDLQFDEDSRSIYGTQSGYLLFLQETDVKNQFRLCVSVSLNGNPADSEENELVWDEFKSESLPNLSTLSINQYLVSFVVKGAMRKSKTIEKLQTLITDLVEFLETHHFVQVCAYSGQEGPVSLYQLGESVFIINEESYQFLKSNLQIEMDSYHSQKENVLLGTIGALLGALIGGAVALFIARLGYVAVAAGLVLGICTIKGYEMFARKLSRKGILISVVLMVVTVFLVNQIDLAMEVVAQLGVEFAYAFRVVNELIASGEYPDNYFFNLGMLAVFTLVGAGISISSVWSSHKTKGTARKIG